jgi:hypothetical protein
MNDWRSHLLRSPHCGHLVLSAEMSGPQIGLDGRHAGGRRGYSDVRLYSAAGSRLSPRTYGNRSPTLHGDFPAGR